VREHPVAAPGPDPVEAVHQAAAPAVATLQGGDPALGTGAPLDELAEPGLVSAFKLSRSFEGSAFKLSRTPPFKLSRTS
jgi:hypothetical protein